MPKHCQSIFVPSHKLICSLEDCQQRNARQPEQNVFGGKKTHTGWKCDNYKRNGPALIPSLNSAHQVLVLAFPSIPAPPLTSPYSTDALFFLQTPSHHEDYTDFHSTNGISICHQLLRRTFLKLSKTLDTIHNAWPGFWRLSSLTS